MIQLFQMLAEIKRKAGRRDHHRRLGGRQFDGRPLLLEAVGGELLIRLIKALYVHSDDRHISGNPRRVGNVNAVAVGVLHGDVVGAGVSQLSVLVTDFKA